MTCKNMLSPTDLRPKQEFYHYRTTTKKLPKYKMEGEFDFRIIN